MNLDGYIQVPERLRLALEKYPDLRIVEDDPKIVEIDGHYFISVKVTVYRDADDPLPTVGTAWEPFPGRTPYTKDSEMMNASTSALGRALGFMGLGIDRSIASANEVQNRQGGDEPAPRPSSGPGYPPTDGQIRMLRALGSTQKPATKAEASKLIDELKAAKAAVTSDEEPF